ncbi:MAG: RdgB/HAM1 family non-canonical purine NTP pyrophosphatase [Chloroflexi bacterium]|nr:RdgB/HAM1 family non-canonical purine NTP pyrophosphatase [Chloroflexota bacterium]
MARETLLIATNNAHKVTELRRILGEADVALLTTADDGIALDDDETGETFEDNARLKARAFCAASGLPSLADDSGIEVDALGGRPGVRSARYGGDGLDDADRTRLLLDELADVPEEQRACRYRVVLVLARPDGSEEVVDGACEGRVAFAPVGENGFGYDPIFYVPRFGRTMAQLDPAEKDAVSHRGQATRRMADLLREHAPEGAAR